LINIRQDWFKRKSVFSSGFPRNALS